MTPKAWMSAMQKKGSMTPARDEPALATPKARPWKWRNQRLMRAFPTTPPQNWAQTQTRMNQSV